MTEESEQPAAETASWQLIVNLIVGLIMLGVIFYLTAHNAVKFYSETLYILIQAAAGTAFAGIGVLGLDNRKASLVVSSLTLALLFIPWCYALSIWPGGDDGGAFAWFFIGGGACALSFFIGFGTLLTGLERLRAQRRKSEEAKKNA